MIFRRQKRQYFFAGLLGVIGIVNVLFFFILFRPFRSEYSNLVDSISKQRADVRMREEVLQRLERTSAQLETFDQDRRELLSRHFITRTEGYGELMRLLDAKAAEAGVRRSRVDYTLPEPIPQFGLYDVRIKIPVTGPYSSIVKFIKDLETAEKMFIIEAIEVRASSEGPPASGPGGSVGAPVAPVAPAAPVARGSAAPRSSPGPNTISLSLTLETFFYDDRT